MNNEILQIYISDVLTYSIALIGIGFAIFTLAFSFIASKKDALFVIVIGESIPLLLVIWKALSRYAKLVKGPL